MRLIESCVWEWASKTPDAIAITDRGHGITYRELANRADRLAARLICAGAGPEVLVALSAARSAELIIGLIAILRSGAAYVPIDPTYPADRRGFLLQDSQCPIVVTENRYLDAFSRHEGSLISLDDEASDRLVTPVTRPSNPSEDRLAYIIYTSGSTGKPKGVQITHANVTRLFSQIEQWFGFNATDVWTLFHSFAFDFSVFEIWGALLYGGRLVIVPYEVTRDALAFHELVCEQNVTVLCQTPSAFRVFSRADALGSSSKLEALRYVVFGGEALDLRLLRPWFQKHGDAKPQMVNMYGITETTVHVTYRVVAERDTSDARSLIGIPIPDLTLHLLDPQGTPVAAGESGEIWVGGAGLARGYLNRPDLTAERFVRSLSPNLPSPLYRTGDLGRICEDGELEYIGRMDRQVQLRGFRVELGEIEAALRGAPQVSDSVVIVHHDAAGESTLIGYLIADHSGALDVNVVAAHIRRELPDYMCPNSLLVIEALPLTPHGKLDHAALPLPALQKKVVVAGQGTCGQIAELYGEILGTPDVVQHSNFFGLGGTSLQAMMLALRVAERFHVVLPPGTVFRNPVVKELAVEVDRAARIGRGSRRELPDYSQWFPLSVGQQQIWLVQKLNPTSTAFHCGSAFRIAGDLDTNRLADAIQRACMRHPSLRTVFDLRSGKPVQQIKPGPLFQLEIEVGSEPQVNQIVRRPIDLSRSCGSAVLLRLPDGAHIFVLVLHHLVTDGWSLTQLLEELAQDYNGTTIEAPATQFVELVAEQQRHLESQEFAAAKEYWKTEFAGAPSVSSVPEEYRRPDTALFQSGRLSFTLSSDLTAGLLAFSQAEQCTPNTLLLSALAVLIQRYSGQRDLVLGVPYAGRDISGSERVHGLFMNLLPIRLRLTDGISFRDLVRETQLKNRTAFTYNNYPFSRVVQDLSIKREAGRQPLVQVIFAPQPDDRSSLSLSGLNTQALPTDPGTTFYDLSLCTWPLSSSTRIGAELIYAADLFSSTRMQGFCDHFVHLLTSAMESPAKPLSGLNLLTQNERDRLLNKWSGRELISQTQLPNFPEDFARTVKSFPDDDAISYGQTIVTYRELDAWSNRIAHALIAHGARTETIVAISCERSPAAMAAVLGVWKAGAAYLPLDPSYPKDRLNWMLQDSSAALLLTTSEATAAIEGSLPRILLDGSINQYSSASVDVAINAKDLAYVIYTSGSTGTPKGVMVEHCGVAALMAAILQQLPLAPRSRVLQYTSLSFDVCVGDIVSTFAQGATMVIPVQSHMLAGAELLDLLETEKISQALVPMSVLAQLEPRPLPHLIRLVSGGERCPAALADRWSGRCEFINAYGPTEASVGASLHKCFPGEGDPPIGRPLQGWTLYVLDEARRILPPFLTGELYIGGNGLARGYLGRPELTRERFIDGTEEIAERLYKTGDLVRWRADGALDFVGRVDGQHKLRGFRIELGELEAALQQDPAIQAAAANVEGEGAAARLVAYVVPEPAFASEALSRNILARLRSKLPDQLIPSEIITVDALPLTPNGKTDRPALSRIPRPSKPPQLEPSAGTDEIAAIWHQVLGQSVGRTVNFFDAGGTSLQMVELQSLLESKTGLRIPLAELFGYPTIEAMSRLVSPALPQVAQSTAPQTDDGRIAVIGMAARFPKAPDVATFWRNLSEGVDGITRFSHDELLAAGVPEKVLRDPGYVPARGIIQDEDKFDAALFEIGAHEAERIDPQQRVWLECALTALEDAGCNPRTYSGAIGVFTGVGAPDYLLQWHAANSDKRDADYQVALGNDKDFAATRTAYKLGLRGPALTIQTACSTSLVAVSMACRQLSAGDCDLAIAGAASLSIPSHAGYLYREGMILSPDGRCRPFDREAQGTVPADGAGAVVLKRLSDALADHDEIYAVISGTAVNNDGDEKVGYTAPGIAGQKDVISRALARAGVSASDVSFVEAHGTGTPMGDPIEFSALRQIFEDAGAKPGSCALGSVKGNLGHLNTAAGIASLIKTVLAIRHRSIPGTLHFKAPNPQLGLEASPFFISADTRPWDTKGPRIAGVSSFGIGGTNAHVILTEAPITPAVVPSQTVEILPISAATPRALQSMATALAAHFETAEVSFHSSAHTLQHGRNVRRERLMVVAGSPVEAAQKFRRIAGGVQSSSRNRATSIGFLFPGQGSQAQGMCSSLAASEPRVQEELQRTGDILKAEAGIDLMVLLNTATPINDTSLTQPILFSVEFSLATVLMEYGISPAFMLGHSLDEYVAACLSGVFSLPQAIALVAERGRLMQSTRAGVMLSVPLPEAEVLSLLGDALDLAAVNGPSQCVVSGDRAEIEALDRTLALKGIQSRLLKTERAFHSRSMDPILDQFRSVLNRVSFNAPKIPFLSCLTGDWIHPSEAVNPDYWVQQLRSPVRFHDALAKLLQKATLLLEVGPGETLSAIARRHPMRAEDLTVLPTLGRTQSSDTEQARWLESIGSAWCSGAPVAWNKLRDREGIGVTHVPSYQFDRKRYWGLPDTRPKAPHVAESKWLYAPVWSAAGRAEGLLKPSRSLVFLDSRGIGWELAREFGPRTILVKAGAVFQQHGDCEFTVNPASRADIISILKATESDPAVHFVHTLALDNSASFTNVDESLEKGYFSVIALVQALGSTVQSNARVSVVTFGAQAAQGPPTNPISATLTGLILVIAREYPNLHCRHIDLAEDELHNGQTIELLRDELQSSSEEQAIAIRRGQRLTRGYQAVEPTLPAIPKLRKNGVYLITGGLGGIGLTLAEHLAVNYNARLILVSRTGLPAEASGEEEIRLRQDMFSRVRESAGRLIVRSADISNDGDARNLVQFAVSEFGSLDGVIHAAGITGGGALQRRTAESSHEILRSKLHGTLALHKALADIPLDFLFLCSSLTALSGTYGQADYTAANAFLDAFAEHLDTPARRVVSVNWDGWRDVGAFARHASGQKRTPLKPQYALLDRWEAAESAYVTELQQDRWIVAEHRVAGESMLPGTVYLELACEVAQAQGLPFPFTIRELTLLTPCSPTHTQSATLFTSFEETNGELEIRMKSREQNGSWKLHAIARVSGNTKAHTEIEPELLALTTAPSSQSLPPHREFIEIGPRWSCLNWRRFAGGHHVGSFSLPTSFAQESADYVLHPALFDTLSGVVHRDGSGAHLPFSYSNVTVLHPLGSAVRVFASDSVASGVLHVRMRIVDGEGRLVVVVEDYALRHANIAMEVR